MADFKAGDLVRFKGDDVEYRIECVNGNGTGSETYELHCVTFDEACIDFIPGRLLELIPRPLKNGDLVMDADSQVYITVSGGKFCRTVSSYLNGESYYDESHLAKPYRKIGSLVLDQ